MSSPTSKPACAPDALVLEVRGGGRISVPRHLGITTYILLEQEDWCEDEIRFVRQRLKPGMRALDIGANFGVYTLAAAGAVGGGGRVWAFEPAPQAADHLAATLALNGLDRVALERCAVSSHGGRVVLEVGPDVETSRVVASGRSGDAVEVPAVTLDEMDSRRDWTDMDFVKLDVEGHETEAVAGGRAFFSRHSPLVMFEIKAGGEIDLAPLAALEAMGYGFYALLPGMLALAPFDRDEPVDGYLLNLFACRPDRAARLAADGILASRAEAPAGRADENAWRAHTRSLPYAAELAPRWRAGPGPAPGTQAAIYRRGLAAFAHSRDERLGAAQRLGWLRYSMDCVEEAASTGEPVAWKISYARLAWELGWRDQAVAALSDAARRLEEAGEEALAEPFISPAPRYDRIPPGARAGDWLRCAVIEQLERLRAYSSAFLEDGSTLSLLEPILDLPFRSPETERRCQLVRMAAGRQPGPRPTPLLCARSQENLNPEFWCRGEHAGDGRT
jgi:FkbM family methyltransferase